MVDYEISYSIIDESYNPNEIVNSFNLKFIIHEYLCTIINELMILRKYNCNINLEKFKNINEKLYIIKILHYKESIYDTILDKYQFNYDTFELNLKINEDEDINIQYKISKIKDFFIDNIKNIVKLEDCNEGYSLKETLNELQEIKQNSQNLIENAELKYKEEVTNLSNEIIDLHTNKNKLTQIKEKEDANRRKYIADKNVYSIIKDKINNNELQEKDVNTAFELFSLKYPIFKFMDDNDLLQINNNDEFENEYLIYDKFYHEVYNEEENTNIIENYVDDNINQKYYI